MSTQMPVLFVGHGSPMIALEENKFTREFRRVTAEKTRGYIASDNHAPLIDYPAQGKEFQLSIPTPEHYLPMLCMPLP